MLEQQTLKQACLQEYLQGPTQIQAPFGSLGSAIQYAYHTLLHPSSSPQPRHPMLKVVGERSWITRRNRKKYCRKVRREEQRLELRLDVSDRSKSVVVGAILFEMATSILHREMDE